MTEPQCVRCRRPLPDNAYACAPCGIGWAGQRLTAIVDMTPAARDVAMGLARRGQNSAAGKPESRLPFDLAATAKLDAVQSTLANWCRHISAERGVPLP